MVHQALSALMNHPSSSSVTAPRSANEDLALLYQEFQAHPWILGSLNKPDLGNVTMTLVGTRYNRSRSQFCSHLSFPTPKECQCQHDFQVVGMVINFMKAISIEVIVYSMTDGSRS